jgi:hypothetical protein
MLKRNSDYLDILCEEGHPRYVNGQEIPNWQQGPTILGAVNHLAWKGWELVLVLDPSALWFGHGKLTFRRLKNPEYLDMVCEEGHPRYVNGQEIPNWQQGPTILSAADHLAWKGWELFLDPSALWSGNGKLTFRRSAKYISP